MTGYVEPASSPSTHATSHVYSDAHRADPAVSHLVFLRAGRRAQCSLGSMLEWRDAAFGFMKGGGKLEHSSEP